MTALTQTDTNRYWTYALWLASFTIFYNLAEGLISMFFGVSDEALTLFGFGADSFIEVMSGIGILAMVIRIRQHPDTPRSQFERTALQSPALPFICLSSGWLSQSSTILSSGINPKRHCPDSSSRSFPSR